MSDTKESPRMADVLGGHFGFRYETMGEGKARVAVTVGPGNVNLGGTLHGGTIATLVDCAGTVAIMTADPQGRPGVTTDLNVSYFAAGRMGDEVVGEARVLHTGKSLAMVEVDVKRPSDGRLLAQGRMTKFFK
jgi:acyl-coenzyme A thioesterase 13